MQGRLVGDTAGRYCFAMYGISTLALLKQHGMYLSASCLGCGHNNELDTDVLIERFGPDHTFIANGEIAASLVCGRCRSKQIEIRVGVHNVPMSEGWNKKRPAG